jgi:hypothetical protein
MRVIVGTCKVKAVLQDAAVRTMRRVVAVYVNDVIMRGVVAPTPRKMRFHHVQNSGSDRLTPHQLTERLA